MASKEPEARNDHAAAMVGPHMLVWGGEGVAQSWMVEIFDVMSGTWQESRTLHGDAIPRGLHKMAVASDGKKAYLFGGYSSITEQFYNKLFSIDISSFECKELVPSPGSPPPPGARDGSKMILHRGTLVVYGGCTGFEAFSDELHVFDLDKGAWCAQTTTGHKPPGLTAHSFTITGSHKAVLFGGNGRNGGRYNDTYVLDLETWNWIKVQAKEDVPGKRSGHTATSIDSMMILVGGLDSHMSIFPDVWLFDVANGQWSKLPLPTAITGRCSHTAVMCGTGADFRVVILFGGYGSSETTLLLLSRRGDSWVIDRVVDSADLKRPDDSLKEQMSGLQIFTPISDERAQQIIDKALQSSSFPLRNIISVLTGLMGSGKTCFLKRIFNQPIPELYTSTGVVEQSYRGLLHHIGSISAISWEMFSQEQMLRFLALLFHEELPPADTLRLAQEITRLATPAGTNPLPLPEPLSTSVTPMSFTSPVPQPASTTGPKPATQVPESATSKSMMRLVKVPKGLQGLSMLELIHVLDTGGQPEHMENMPSLIHQCHLAIIILNLLFGIDDFPIIHLHEEGKIYTKRRSQLSNRHIIQKIASTIQAKRFVHKKGQHFQMLAVATHRDCVPEGELPTRVREYHKALKEILLPACTDELICYSSDQIPFVLNLKAPDSNDLAKLDLIRKKVSENEVGEVIQTPGAFLIFEQELVEFADKVVSRDIVSLSECLQVGAKLKMDPEVVMGALVFFHRQLTFLYFRHVLPNLVFTNPQTPLDCINAIVKFSYKVEAGDVKGVTKTLTNSLRDGIITEQILMHEELSACFIKGPQNEWLYGPQDAIKLLYHNFTLAPLSRDQQQKLRSALDTQTTPSSRKKREYLMMSLHPVIADKDILQYLPAASEIAPLVVQFTKNCVPLSCFSRTISCLLAMYDWKLSRTDNGSPECLAHNIVSLYDSQLPLQIIVRDATSHLEVHIRPEKSFTQSCYPNACFQIRETIFSAIKQVLESLQLTGIETSPAFLCPCSMSNMAHIASLNSLFAPKFLRCSITGKSVGIIRDTQQAWLKTPATAKDKPSLPKLLKLKVHQKIVDYTSFGILLLDDEDGAHIGQIKNDCHYLSEMIIIQILTKWIRGGGKPVTWTSLLETLRICGLNELANVIEKNTKVQTPGAFLIFEQELLDFATNVVNRDVVSLSECLQVGAKLKMDPEVVMGALVFFHRQLTFLYFRHVLPNLVFTNPQTPLDCINAIVKFSQRVTTGDVKGVAKVLIDSLRDGIITEEILSHKEFTKCFIKSPHGAANEWLYGPQDAIKLLYHNFTLAPLSHDQQQKLESTSTPSSPVEREKREYLMMSLYPVIADKDILQYLPAATEIAPLVVEFTKNCVPLSCFSRTISCLLAMYDWKLSRADDGSPECLAHNIVSLYDSQLPLQIIVRDATSHLEVHIHPEKSFTQSCYPNACFQIRETIFSAIKQVLESLQLTGIETSPAFLCPCSMSNMAHIASLDSSDNLRCSKAEKNAGIVSENQKVWLKKSATGEEKPSLSKLLKLQLHHKIVDYTVFGIFLLEDEDGSLIGQIKNDCHQLSEMIIIQILTKWIRGEGKSVTWTSLLETLRICGLNELADNIENTK